MAIEPAGSFAARVADAWFVANECEPDDDQLNVGDAAELIREHNRAVARAVINRLVTDGRITPVAEAIMIEAIVRGDFDGGDDGE